MGTTMDVHVANQFSTMVQKVILTCEHAGNRVPTEYAKLFQGKQHVLDGHRGWDPGSVELGKTFKRRLKAPLFCAHFTRLLVEPNRSIGHCRLFSEFTRDLDDETKQTLLNRYYHPHRNQVKSWITDQTAADHFVIHLSLHTFTPKLNGQLRTADVGLLYDPRRSQERKFSDAWRTSLIELRPDLRVRRNYPYLGSADGFTTYLRKQMPQHLYAGIELEVNQNWPRNKDQSWRTLQINLAESFAEAMQNCRTIA